MKIFCSAKTEPNTAVNSDRAKARRVTLFVGRINVAPMRRRAKFFAAPAGGRKCPVRRVAVLHYRRSEILLHNLASFRFRNVKRHPPAINQVWVAPIKKFVYLFPSCKPFLQVQPSSIS